MDIVKGKYRHFKGGEYEVIDIAIHSETLEEYVLYRQLYGDRKLWIRPKEMFFGFTADGQKRFVFIGE